MDPKTQLREAIAWTKQAGTWLNENHPSFAKFADPIMLKTAANLGYLVNIQNLIEATQAPSVIQTALYAAAGVGLPKFNEIVVSEINRGLHEYNSRQSVGNKFAWGKSLLLAGTASLALSNLVESSDCQGTPMYDEGEIKYVNNEQFVQEPTNDTLTEIIVEPEWLEEPDYIEPDFNLDLELSSELEEDLSDMINKNLVPVNLENFEELEFQLKETLSLQEVIERELHPKAQVHYKRFNGVDKKRLIRKIERTKEFDDLLKSAAEKYDVPYTIMFALTIKESDGKPRAKSYANARGLMQITPSTGKYIAKLMGDKFVELTGRSRLRKNDLYNPKINIEMGAFYLRFIHDHYGERIMRKRGQMPNNYKEWTNEDVWDFTMGCYNRGPNGMTRNMLNAGADTFWDLEKEQTTDEVLRYVPKIRAIERFHVEYLQQQAGMNDEVARLVH